MKNFKAFTLVEVMVCLILTGVVAFFIYTMMLTAHRSYFKLFTVSRQKNDIRYFETLIKNSIWNAQDYTIENNKLKFIYYSTYQASIGYRIDIYDCSGVLEEKTPSQINTLLGDKKNSQIKETYSTTGSSNIRLTSYRGSSSYGNALASAPAINDEIVMENVNKIYYSITKDSSHTPIFNLAIVYNRELDDGEIDYEYIIYSICMKNLFYMDRE